MTDEREYWRSAIVGRIDEQQPIYAGELLDEIVDLRAQLAEANTRIEALEAKQRKFVERASQHWEQERLEANKVIYAAAKRIEVLGAGLTKIEAGKLWRYITDVYVCRWCDQPGGKRGIKHYVWCPTAIAEKALEGSK